MYQLNPLLEFNFKDPRFVASAAGSAIGAAGGALSGIQKDENGERHILRNATIGAGLGGTTGYFAGKHHKNKINNLTDKVNKWKQNTYNLKKKATREFDLLNDEFQNASLERAAYKHFANYPDTYTFSIGRHEWFRNAEGQIEHRLLPKIK